ncbi:conserved protein, unknown function [Hepatocystis sp. ex Piliocolobus tephrosceles]|nr:conserved protein, unknown function [Hepatocystis sp. ex Piliocolobus tephrosceles]
MLEFENLDLLKKKVTPFVLVISKEGENEIKNAIKKVSSVNIIKQYNSEKLEQNKMVFSSISHFLTGNKRNNNIERPIYTLNKYNLPYSSNRPNYFNNYNNNNNIDKIVNMNLLNYNNFNNKNYNTINQVLLKYKKYSDNLNNNMIKNTKNGNDTNNVSNNADNNNTNIKNDSNNTDNNSNINDDNNINENNNINDDNNINDENFEDGIEELKKDYVVVERVYTYITEGSSVFVYIF